MQAGKIGQAVLPWCFPQLAFPSSKACRIARQAYQRQIPQLIFTSSLRTVHASVSICRQRVKSIKILIKNRKNATVVTKKKKFYNINSCSLPSSWTTSITSLGTGPSWVPTISTSSSGKGSSPRTAQNKPGSYDTLQQPMIVQEDLG